MRHHVRSAIWRMFHILAKINKVRGADANYPATNIRLLLLEDRTAYRELLGLLPTGSAIAARAEADKRPEHTVPVVQAVRACEPRFVVVKVGARVSPMHWGGRSRRAPAPLHINLKLPTLGSCILKISEIPVRLTLKTLAVHTNMQRSSYPTGNTSSPNGSLPCSIADPVFRTDWAQEEQQKIEAGIVSSRSRFV